MLNATDMVGDILSEERKKAGLRQEDVAQKLQQHQSFIARIETGKRRVDVLEFCELARIIGFDPGVAINQLCSMRKTKRAAAQRRAGTTRVGGKRGPGKRRGSG